MIDGGLRPPMSARVDGKLREATEVGVWEEAEEHPEMADENGRFKLDKGNGKLSRPHTIPISIRRAHLSTTNSAAHGAILNS